jgi:hypothetical protein
MSFNSCSDPRHGELPDIDLPQHHRTSTQFIVDRNESGSDNDFLNGKLVSLIILKNRLNLTLSVIRNMYNNFLRFMTFSFVPNMLVNLFFSSFLDREIGERRRPELPDIDIPSLLRPSRNFNQHRTESGSDTETVGKDVTDMYKHNISFLLVLYSNHVYKHY